MEKKIKIIPATLDEHGVSPLNNSVKKRAAAYCRVSTESDEQAGSYLNQV